MLPWNNDTIIEKTDGWIWCRHETAFFQYMHAWNQGGIIIIVSISLLQVLFFKNTVNLKEWVNSITLLKQRKSNSSNGWLQMDLWINSIPMKKTDDGKCLFKRNTVPLKMLDQCKWPPEIMVVPLKCMAASATLK